MDGRRGFRAKHGRVCRDFFLGRVGVGGAVACARLRGCVCCARVVGDRVCLDIAVDGLLGLASLGIGCDGIGVRAVLPVFVSHHQHAAGDKRQDRDESSEPDAFLALAPLRDLFELLFELGVTEVGHGSPRVE